MNKLNKTIKDTKIKMKMKEKERKEKFNNNIEKAKSKINRAKLDIETKAVEIYYTAKYTIKY